MRTSPRADASRAACLKHGGAELFNPIAWERGTPLGGAAWYPFKRAAPFPQVKAGRDVEALRYTGSDYRSWR
jgi:hypothetical protein